MIVVKTPLLYFTVCSGAREEAESGGCIQVCCKWTQEEVTLRRSRLWGKRNMWNESKQEVYPMNRKGSHHLVVLWEMVTVLLNVWQIRGYPTVRLSMWLDWIWLDLTSFCSSSVGFSCSGCAGPSTTGRLLSACLSFQYCRHILEVRFNTVSDQVLSTGCSLCWKTLWWISFLKFSSNWIWSNLLVDHLQITPRPSCCHHRPSRLF